MTRVGVDLRAHGPAAETVRQMVAAIELAQAERPHFRAWPVEVVVGDALKLSADPRVLAVVGPFRSADMAAALPTLNQQHVIALSASNTYAPLTVRAPAFESDAPDRFYPSGTRSYVRLFPNDLHQAAALAHVAEAEGVTRPYVLHDGQPYGAAIAEGFVRAARAAGLAVAGMSEWHAGGVLEAQPALANADALVLCGVVDGRVRQLIAAFGPGGDAFQVLAADGFLNCESLGPDAAGMLAISPGIGALGRGYPDASQFVAQLAARLGLTPDAIVPYAVHAAEVMRLLVDALAYDDAPTRPSLRERLFDGTVRHGLLGPYTILPSGDISAEDSPILGFTMHRASIDGAFAPEASVIPDSELVNAAFAGS